MWGLPNRDTYLTRFLLGTNSTNDCFYSANIDATTKYMNEEAFLEGCRLSTEDLLQSGAL